MALRQLAARVNLRTLGAPGARGFASMPTVFDHMVEFVVVDEAGNRHVCRGLEGQTVSEALLEHSGMDTDFMTPTPTGKNMVDCHLYVSKEDIAGLPDKTEEEANNLTYISTDLRDNSRLGSAITLSKATQGITVAIASVLPFNTP